MGLAVCLSRGVTLSAANGSRLDALLPFPLSGFRVFCSPSPASACSAISALKAVPAGCQNVLANPDFVGYTSGRPIRLRGCFITPSPLMGEGRGEGEKDLAPSGPCSPLDPFGGAHPLRQTQVTPRAANRRPNESLPVTDQRRVIRTGSQSSASYARASNHLWAYGEYALMADGCLR